MEAAVKRLLTYLSAYKKESVLAPLFKLLEALLDLLVPMVVAQIIDVGIKTSNTGILVRYVLVLVLLAAVGLFSSVLAQYFAAKAAVGFAKNLRGALYRKINTFTYTDIDAMGAPTMMTRMTSDINQLQNGVNMVLRLFLRSPFIVFGAMIMAFTIDAKAALVFVAAIPVLTAVVFAIILITIPKYRQVQGSLDGVLGATRENLSGSRVIRAFGIENSEIRRFDEKNEVLTRIQLFAGRISALLNPVTYVIINAAVIALIYVGALRVESGILTQGAVIALYNYMSQILVELIKLANLIITMTKAAASANRVAATLELVPSAVRVEASCIETDAKVIFDDVGLTYQGAGGQSLQGIRLTVPPGQTVGVIGGTGAGKSSLVQLIPGLYPATQGTVLVDGLDVRAYDPAVLRNKVGIVPQKAVLFRGTVRSNLQWGNSNADDAAMLEALRAAQAYDFVMEKGGLDAPVAEGGKNFSGGQRQRLTIARALVRQPEILILDDSASALDYATDAALRKALRALPFHPTTFIVSQRTSSLRDADQILVLDNGAQVGLGTHEALLASCEIYREIYDSQYKKEAT